MSEDKVEITFGNNVIVATNCPCCNKKLIVSKITQSIIEKRDLMKKYEIPQFKMKIEFELEEVKDE